MWWIYEVTFVACLVILRIYYLGNLLLSENYALGVSCQAVW